MEERIYLSQPHINGREKEYIDKAFQTNNITLFGENVNEFERKISKYLGGKNTLAVNSGTAGLHLALRYAGVQAGDLVICSTLTFAASCNPVKYLGGELLFVDSDEDTFNMSPLALRRALDWSKANNKAIKAAIIVDLYGQPAKYDVLIPMLKEENIVIIEDAAEALGSSYKGKKCGTFGDFGVFSFNSNKIITTGGGGMIVSDNSEAIEKMRYWAMQAREPLPYYEHKEYGYQYRMSNILAGIGCAQVDMIDTYARRRQYIYDKYSVELKGLPIKLMPKINDGTPNCWLTVINFLDETNPIDLIEHLEKYNIETRMVWKPMHLQPVYSKCMYFDDGKGDCSKTLFETGLCLPSASVMTDEQLEYVIDKIKDYFK